MFDFSINVENTQVYCDVTTLLGLEICLTFIIQGVTGGTDQTSGGCSLC